jgi:predicted CXXCH cytochrome family protein
LNRSTSRVSPNSLSSETGTVCDGAPPFRWKKCRTIISLVVACLCWSGLSSNAQTELKAPAPTVPSAPAQSLASSPGPPGNEACVKCHAAIWATYSSKPMARASASATQDFIPGDFSDAASGVHYRVYLEDGHAWLSFDRDGAMPLHGKRRLDYVIGSGHRGKTYIFSDEGFAFESPINFYAGVGAVPGGQWDRTPKYRGGKEVPLTLPAASSCLHCHTSDAQIPEEGTENKYASPLFTHGGITCERCHGDDLSHGVVTGKKSGKSPPETAHAAGAPPSGMVNPAKLSPVRRDDICMQCHLEGNAMVEQPGRHLYQFRPGDDLSDFVRYYVLTSDGKEKLRAVSQFEALAQSACKRSAGDALTCTTCHDPHSSPKPAERVAYYRAKCLNCHRDEFAAKHHLEQQDCSACHMPRVQALDVAHTQDRDHRILRIPAPRAQNPASAVDAATAPPIAPQLAQFPPTHGPESPRGLALAWSAMAAAGSQYAADQAKKFLPAAAVENPEDPLILQALGYHEQSRGLLPQAREHYERALRANPLAVDAAANLALLEAQQGNFDRAIALWKAAFARYPGRSTLGIDLARAQCLGGHGDDSRASLARVLQFNPDLTLAHDMLRQLQSGEVKCDGN